MTQGATANCRETCLYATKENARTIFVTTLATVAVSIMLATSAASPERKGYPRRFTVRRHRERACS